MLWCLLSVIAWISVQPLSYISKLHGTRLRKPVAIRIPHHFGLICSWNLPTLPVKYICGSMIWLINEFLSWLVSLRLFLRFLFFSRYSLRDKATMFLIHGCAVCICISRHVQANLRTLGHVIYWSIKSRASASVSEALISLCGCVLFK